MHLGAAVVEGAHGHVDGRGIWYPTVSLYPLPLHVTILILTPLLTLAVLIFFFFPLGVFAISFSHSDSVRGLHQLWGVLCYFTDVITFIAALLSPQSQSM